MRLSAVLGMKFEEYRDGVDDVYSDEPEDLRKRHSMFRRFGM